jgi:hypothetical protein
VVVSPVLAQLDLVGSLAGVWMSELLAGCMHRSHEHLLRFVETGDC